MLALLLAASIAVPNNDAEPVCGHAKNFASLPLDDVEGRRAALAAVVAAYDDDRPSASCLAAALTDLKTGAVEHHRKAKRAHTAADFELAVDAYVALVRMTTSTKERHRFAFFRAEALSDLGRWRDAADAYRATVAIDPDGAFAREAAVELRTVSRP